MIEVLKYLIEIFKYLVEILKYLKVAWDNGDIGYIIDPNDCGEFHCLLNRIEINEINCTLVFWLVVIIVFEYHKLNEFPQTFILFIIANLLVSAALIDFIHICLIQIFYTSPFPQIIRFIMIVCVIEVDFGRYWLFYTYVGLLILNINYLLFRLLLFIEDFIRKNI